MTEVIEVAKTGRARCRSCRQAIEKGALRFGEEQPSAFAEGMQMAWYHLPCAAGKRPAQVREALSRFEGEVPGRDEIEKLLAGGRPTRPWPIPTPNAHPPADRSAFTAHEPIEKGALRVAVEREVEMAGATRLGAGYLHPGLRAGVHGHRRPAGAALENSRKLVDTDREELSRVLSA